MIGKEVTVPLSASVTLFNSEALVNHLGNIFAYTPISGKLISYTDKAVNIQIPFNIGRSQIATTNDTEVTGASYIRQYSAIPSETQPIFVLGGNASLVSPATDCTDDPGKSFCHGTFSIWFDRTAVESTLQ